MRKLFLLILLAAPLAAQRATRPKNKAVKAEKAEAVADVASVVPAEDIEMAAVRAIQVRSKATYADLCRIILLQRAEFLRFKTDAERCDFVSSLGLLSLGDKDPYATPVTLGVTLKSAIYAHSLEQSLMLRLTGWSWYALQSAEALGIVPEGSSVSDEISGAELMQIMDEALNLSEEVKDWNKPENPYREFGHETYEEMYHNPGGPVKTK